MEALEMKIGAAAARPQQEENEHSVCGICEAIVTKRGLLDCCDHVFCFSCIEDWAAVTNLCPMCKSQFKLLSLVNTTTAGDASAGKDECSSGDKRTPDESFSYFIDEEAVSCLEGEKCKLRGEQNNLEDTSVACDGCDRWYHACCVGFDPGKPCRTWHCPRCKEKGVSETVIPASNKHATSNKQKHVDDLSFSFTETGESAIVVSLASSNETEKVQNEPRVSSVSESRQKTSLDKLLDDLVKQGSFEEDDDLDEQEEEPDVEEKLQDELQEPFDFDAEEEQQLEQEVQDIFKEAEEGDDETEEPQDGLEPAFDHGQEDYMDVENPSTSPETVEETGLNLEELVSDDGQTTQSVQKVGSQSEKLETQVVLQPVQPDEKDGVRTRIIMKRETEEVSLVETIRQQVMADKGCTDLSNDQLLAAYKAAMVKRTAPKPSKAPIDSARQKLKMKLYGGIRGRRVYDRDWDVAFWRDKVLGEKRRQAQQTQTQEEKVDTRVQEPPSDPITDRLCLADSSLLPKVDGANPLPPSRDISKPKASDKISLMKPKAVETKVEEAADANAAKDKRKWALELLARKNKQQVRAEHDGLKGTFANLSRLPIEMRPVLEPNPRSKVPSAVRQVHLNRFADLYLKNVTVGRNQASIDAVNAALAMEKEISDKSNIKNVYVNLCVRALARGDTPTTQAADGSTQDTVTEALLATGLISDSPPGSPEREPGKTEATTVEHESPRKKPKYEADASSSSLFGKEGINALLEHLKKEEVELAVETDPPPPAADSKEQEVETLEREVETMEKLQDKQENDAGQQEKKQEFEEQAEKRKGDGNERPNKEEEKASGDSMEMDLDSRIDRVRSNIVQHMNETSNMAEQMIRENAGVVERSPKPPAPAKAVHRSRKPAPQPTEADAQKPAAPSVQKQVEMYIKEHIRPLHKSGVIKSEQYQWTVSKTTAKVLQFHKDATSADFLIAEGSRVKKLAEQYLQRYAQEKQSSNPGRRSPNPA